MCVVCVCVCVCVCVYVRVERGGGQLGGICVCVCMFRGWGLGDKRAGGIIWISFSLFFRTAGAFIRKSISCLLLVNVCSVFFYFSWNIFNSF